VPGSNAVYITYSLVLLLVPFLLRLHGRKVCLAFQSLVVQGACGPVRGSHASQIQAALVDGDDAQPVAKTLRHGQPIEVLKGLEKGSLRQVLGQVKVVQHTDAHPYTACLYRSTSVSKVALSPCRVRTISSVSL
jgi:hypothetical protein